MLPLQVNRSMFPEDGSWTSNHEICPERVRVMFNGHCRPVGSAVVRFIVTLRLIH